MHALLHSLAVAARPWFEQHLADPFVHTGPRGLLWWQWVAIPVYAVASWVVGRLFGWITRRILGAVFARTQTTWDDLLLERIASPLTALWSIGVAYAMLPWLALSRAGEASVEGGLHAAVFVVLVWAALRSVDLAFDFLGSFPWARANPLAAGVLPLGSRIARVAVAIIGSIAVLTQLGYPVASLLAGLGIGGLALALAAQKTVENLFGSVSISVDQPCRIGDFVQVENVTGTVEGIGLRSTRIRTLARTIVTIPNGKLADARIENFAVRDRLRLFCVLGLVYGTTAEQVRQVIAGVERALSEHPKLYPDGLSVRFVNIGASSLDVEVSAWLATADWGEFTRLRQELYLRFLEVVEGAGTALAFPTQTVHVASLPERQESPPPRAERRPENT